MTDEPAADLVAEIAAEARRRREAGEHDPGLERRLDEAFGHMVGHRRGDDQLTQGLWAVAANAHINADAGVHEPASRLKRLAKRVLAKLFRWYVLRVTNQVTTFANVTASTLRMLSDRIESLSDEVAAALPPVLPGRAELPPGAAPRSPLDRHQILSSAVCERMAGVGGRVLHADCGSGELVSELSKAGTDAYGVDPSARHVAAPVAAGLDLVQGQLLEHLRSVSTNGLGGAVVSGSVDRLRLGDARMLAHLLGTRVASGGRVVIAGTYPPAWELTASPVERDLSPGRPLHPETWMHLLGANGVADLEVVEGPVVPELGAPDGYAVFGVRTR